MNVHPIIGNLAIRPEGGVDWAFLEAAATRLSIDDVLDIAEVDEVGRSWRDATQANLDMKADRDRRQREQSAALRRARARVP